jgi:hypothetical protein
MLSQDSGPPDGDLNSQPSEYEAGTPHVYSYDNDPPFHIRWV